MCPQHDVVGLLIGRELPPAARATDDVTSHLAAQEHTASGQRERHCAIVLRAVKSHPGKTSFELSLRCPLDRYEVARRLPDLLVTELVQKGPRRRCEVSGKLALTWYPAGHDAELQQAA